LRWSPRAICGAVLGAETAGILNRFVELGCVSLSATTPASRIPNAIHGWISSIGLFDAFAVEEQARIIEWVRSREDEYAYDTETGTADRQ
jgi:hypothetical protein